MSVNETVASVVERIHAAYLRFQDEWVEGGGHGRIIACVDEYEAERLVIDRHILPSGTHTESEWATHPAVFVLGGADRSYYPVRPEIALASWAVEDGALDAMLAAGVDAAYARAAHQAGATDAWVIIAGWEAGIPVEYLSAAS